MIETRVRVLRHTDGISLVEATEQNGCGACSHQDGCAVAGLGRFLGHRRQPIALACGDTRPGQEITVAVAGADLARAGLWAYLLPAALAVAGAAVLASRGDVASLIGAILGLAAGLLIARHQAGAPKIFIHSGEQA
ncbi:MAG: SoxR reducing system RseC family protein [Gallionellaceae bacterium]|nr:SoxR reducing system RseC family protein [Gallionellaceae bacterium]